MIINNHRKVSNTIRISDFTITVITELRQSECNASTNAERVARPSLFQKQQTEKHDHEFGTSEGNDGAWEGISEVWVWLRFMKVRRESESQLVNLSAERGVHTVIYSTANARQVS